MTEETLTNNSLTLETSGSDEFTESGAENPDDNGGDFKEGVNIRDSLTRKATQFLDESDYNDDEFASLLDMYDKTMKSFELVQSLRSLMTRLSLISDLKAKD